MGRAILMGWPRVPGLRLVWTGVVLIVLGIGLSVTAAMQFRREGTEINPTFDGMLKNLNYRLMWIGLLVPMSQVDRAIAAKVDGEQRARLLERVVPDACRFHRE